MRGAMTRVKTEVEAEIDIEELIDNLDTPEYLKLLEKIVDGIFWDDDIIEEFVKILKKRDVPIKDYVPNEETEEYEWR